MSKRQQDRENKRTVRSIVAKAKKDMQDWITELGYIPTEDEIRAFQAGYISGINRGSNFK